MIIWANDSYNISLFVEDRVDLLELNHFYDEDGGVVFDQYVFWEDTEYGHVIREWRLIKDGRLILTGEAHNEAKAKDEILLLKELGWKKFPKDFEPKYVSKWIGSSIFHVNFINKHIDFNDNNINRRIYFGTYCETWSQNDPELANREILPKEQRRPFRNR